jgi:hypothetical protein
MQSWLPTAHRAVAAAPFVYCHVPFAFDHCGVPGGTVCLTDDGGASWSAVHVPS